MSTKAFRLEIAGNGFWQKKFRHNFWAKRAIFLGKYFKKSINTVSLLEQTARIKGVYTNITISTRVVPYTDLAGYPAAGYPANNFAGYRISG